ncbi:unnamed protein product [Lathyrus oleraceus]
MQEERAQIQQGMKLLQQMQLELLSERPKEMFIKEHVESVGTSTNGSCSKVMTTEDLTKKMDASEDYLKKINNLKNLDIYIACVSPRISTNYLGFSIQIGY